MIQLRPWKIVLVVLAFVFGLVFALPNALPKSAVDKLPGWIPSQRLNLGLDLQGGSYLLFEVDTNALKAERLTNLTEDARRTLTDAHILFSGLSQANGSVQVTITDPNQVNAAYQALIKLSPQSATGGRDLVVTTSGQQIVMTYTPQSERTLVSSAVDQTIEVIRRRVDQLGTREPTIIRQGVNRILVEAPGESDPERLRAVIGKTAKLTFQMMDETVTPADIASGHVPPEDMVLPTEIPQEPKIAVARRVLVSGEMLISASQGFDPQTNAPVVNFRFNGQGASRFAQVTSQNVGKRFAIILDNKVISAPVIQTPILGGQGQISGNFTQESANDLALLLRSGALPAPLHVEEQSAVGAELGADTIRSGQLALALGAVLIFAFIILAYGLFGIFAAIALVVNGLLLVALMSVTQATLTLPGIAGLILTLAVAVDANVLIYERMRDESRAGRTPLVAADNGYRRALVTIFDANITTLIAAAIMFQFGTGAVRGFAWTLSIGVLTSVFTAVLITQVLIGLWFRAKRPKKLPIV